MAMALDDDFGVHHEGVTSPVDIRERVSMLNRMLGQIWYRCGKVARCTA